LSFMAIGLMLSKFIFFYNLGCNEWLSVTRKAVNRFVWQN
jgi:hypothetical protein